MRTCARSPLRRHGFIKSMPLEGQAAPTPWWCWLSCCLCFLCGFWLMTCQSYSSYIHFRGVTKWATQACTIPPVVWCQKELCGGVYGKRLMSTPIVMFVAFLEQARWAEQFWCVNGKKIPNIKWENIYWSCVSDSDVLVKSKTTWQIRIQATTTTLIQVPSSWV